MLFIFLFVFVLASMHCFSVSVKTTTISLIDTWDDSYDKDNTPESTSDDKITALLQWTLIPVALIVVIFGFCWKCSRCVRARGSQTGELIEKYGTFLTKSGSK